MSNATNRVGTFRRVATPALLLVALVAVVGAAAEQPPYRDPAQPVERQVEDLLGRMTLAEKVALLGGDRRGSPTSGLTAPNLRLGIPALEMIGGGEGLLRVPDRIPTSTSFPAPTTMAATWDVELNRRLGEAIARETLALGGHVVLAPCININRVPVGGRNFESYGEDPHLAARMSVAFCRGVQSQGVVATPKHYALNNQEYQRHGINVEVDERALREIYLPAFKASVQEGGAWAVMAAYNKVRGDWCTESRYLLTDILKGEWGFRGLVMSDWNATHSTVGAANAGLDLEMPFAKFFGPPLREAVSRGEVSEATIDDKVRRILRVMLSMGIFDREPAVDREVIDGPEHRALALEGAREGIVLLKNEGGLLPLDRGRVRRIAVIGPNAAVARISGGGSVEVWDTAYAVSPLEGILKSAGREVEVRHVRGCGQIDEFETIPSAYLEPPAGYPGTRGLLAELFPNTQLAGEPTLERLDRQVDFEWARGAPDESLRHADAGSFSVRWTGVLRPPSSGEYRLGVKTAHFIFSYTVEGTARLFLDGRELELRRAGRWLDREATVALEAGRAYELRFEYADAGWDSIVRLGWIRPDDEIAAAANAARESDVAVVVVGLDDIHEREGADRPDVRLPEPQDRLIEAIVEANPSTVVVLNTGLPLDLVRWVDRVPALVHAGYPGQEGGAALGEILFGDVNPSGKLPFTLPRLPEHHSGAAHYPGEKGVVRLGEGIFVGYRHFDRAGIEPLFPFGHGLAYTSFSYGALGIEPGGVSAGERVTARLQVTNDGPRPGAEVVQLYVRDVESSLERPPKELKAFRKVRLAPGETTTVSFELDESSFAFYDPERKAWVIEPGLFEILVGSSSRDIRRRGELLVR